MASAGPYRRNAKRQIWIFQRDFPCLRAVRFLKNIEFQTKKPARDDEADCVIICTFSPFPREHGVLNGKFKPYFLNSRLPNRKTRANLPTWNRRLVCHPGLGSIFQPEQELGEHPPHTALERERSPRATRVSKAPSMTRTTADVARVARARSSGSRGVPRARASLGIVVFVPFHHGSLHRFLSLHRCTRLVVQRINRWFYTKSTVVYTVSKPTKLGNVRSQSWREGDGHRCEHIYVGHIYLLILLEPLAFLLRHLLVAAGEGELLASETLLLLGILSCRERVGWDGVRSVDGLRVAEARTRREEKE